jgi:hypothetical protein
MSGSKRGTRREASSDGEDDVMAAVDRSAGVSTYVIADVSVDDAWLAVPDAEALRLGNWR